MLSWDVRTESTVIYIMWQIKPSEIIVINRRLSVAQPSIICITANTKKSSYLGLVLYLKACIWKESINMLISHQFLIINMSSKGFMDCWFDNSLAAEVIEVMMERWPHCCLAECTKWLNPKNNRDGNCCVHSWIIYDRSKASSKLADDSAKHLWLNKVWF